jgi:hypothetical protein
LKMAVFWVVASCSLVDVYQRFRGPCCLHHQGDELQPRRQSSSYSPQWEPHILQNMVLFRWIWDVLSTVWDRCEENSFGSIIN